MTSTGALRGCARPRGNKRRACARQVEQYATRHLQIMDASPSAPRASPSARRRSRRRTTRWRREACHATQPCHPEGIARRKLRHRGVQAHTARRHLGERRCGIRRPAPRKSWPRAFRAARIPIPPAGGRGDGRRAAGDRQRAASGCARSAPRAHGLKTLGGAVPGDRASRRATSGDPVRPLPILWAPVLGV